jgi:hypothetical protein
MCLPISSINRDIVWLPPLVFFRVGEEVLPLHPLVQKPVGVLGSQCRCLSVHDWSIKRCGFIHAFHEIWRCEA